MITKQVIERIIVKAGSNQFGSDLFHLYICYGDKAIEECEVEITALDSCVEVFDTDDQTYIWIPYSQITEISIVDDRPENEPETVKAPLAPLEKVLS